MSTGFVASEGVDVSPHRSAAALGFVLAAFVVWSTERVCHSHMAVVLDELSWFHSAGRWLSNASYSLYFLPFVLRPLQPRRDIRWRLLIAFAFEIMVTIAYLILASRWLPRLPIVPCLEVASAFSIMWVSFWAGAVSIAVPLAAIPIAILVLFARAHRWWDVLASILLGWSAYRLAVSGQLGFLALPDPWLAIRRHLRNLANLFGKNTLEVWDRMYRAGYWDFLREADQRPRHHIIAGIVTEEVTCGPEVLDVGCGHGVLFSVLEHASPRYLGIDLSPDAISECRRVFASSPHGSFEAVSFEDLLTTRRFDAVVFNEVLYYFPLRALPQLIQKAVTLLKEDGIILVSMHRNLKSRSVWRALEHSLRLGRKIRVHNVLTGSVWTVASYRPLSRELWPSQ